jgi:hypothetical protein
MLNKSYKKIWWECTKMKTLDWFFISSTVSENSTKQEITETQKHTNSLTFKHSAEQWLLQYVYSKCTAVFPSRCHSKQQRITLNKIFKRNFRKIRRTEENYGFLELQYQMYAHITFGVRIGKWFIYTYFCCTERTWTGMLTHNKGHSLCIVALTQ